MATTKLPNVRLAFPQLWNASQVNGEGEAKFSANLIMEPNSPAHKAVQGAIDAIMKAKWGDKAPGILKAMNKDKVPLRNGDDHLDKQGEVYNGFEGMKYLVAKSKTRPTLLDQLKNPVSEEDGVLYAGCFVNVHIEIKCGDIPKVGKTVWAVLTGVQKFKDGDAFSGGRPADPDEFEEVAEEGVSDLA